MVLFRLANASDVCPCSFWLKAGDHKCHRSVPFASWKYDMYIYIYTYIWKLQLSWPSKSDFISVSHQDWLRFTWSKRTSTFSSLSGFKLKVLRDDLEISSRCAQPCPVNSFWPPYNVIPHKICSNFEITRSVRRIGAKKIWFSTDFQLRSKASLKSATSAALKLSSEDMEVTSARGCQAQALRPTQPTSCGLLEEHPKKCLSGIIQQMALEAVSLDLEPPPISARIVGGWGHQSSTAETKWKLQPIGTFALSFCLSLASITLGDSCDTLDTMLFKTAPLWQEMLAKEVQTCSTLCCQRVSNLVSLWRILGSMPWRLHHAAPFW